MIIKKETIIEVANINLEEEMVVDEDIELIKSWVENKQYQDLYNYFKFNIAEYVNC